MNTLLTHPCVAALATTLLHSLWMFAVLIGLGWWSARALAEARHRDLAYLLSLLSLPLSFAAVFFMEWRARTDAWSSAALLRDKLGTEVTLELTGNLSKLGIENQPRWIGYIAVAYLLGLLVSLAISAYRYWATVRMRRSGWPAPPEFRPIFERLRRELMPDRRVDWRITKRVAGAVAVGILRPVILFPVGLVNALSPDEVEAILRHELTHLLRHDPVWNAVQEVIVCLFFYHPLVYLLARWLNREREFACDDAVSRATDRTTYARALVRAAKFSLHPLTPFTMAATDNRHFSTRIQRLFTPTDAQQAPGTPSRSFLLAPLAILPLFFLFAFTPASTEWQGWPDTETTATADQDWTIQGTVTDCTTGDPLIGTAVVLEGTKNGAITDFNGNYTLRVPGGKQAITYSYVGYESVSLPANVSRNLNADIAMCKDQDGKVTLREGDSSISFEAKKTDAPKTTSVLSAMGTELLIIVDGKRHTSGTTDDISPDTIEKVEVVKDVEKIKALGYGIDFKGAILITTKK